MGSELEATACAVWWWWRWWWWWWWMDGLDDEVARFTAQKFESLLRSDKKWATSGLEKVWILGNPNPVLLRHRVQSVAAAGDETLTHSFTTYCEKQNKKETSAFLSFSILVLILSPSLARKWSSTSRQTSWSPQRTSTSARTSLRVSRPLERSLPAILLRRRVSYMCLSSA